MITCSSILCTMDGLIQKVVDKIVPFHNQVLKAEIVNVCLRRCDKGANEMNFRNNKYISHLYL